MDSITDKQGHVYILSNVAMPGKLKIGMTTRNLDERVKELSSATGVPAPFKLEHYRFFEDCVLGELLAHQRLGQYRDSASREFFSLDLDTARATVDKVWNDMAQPDSLAVDAERLYDSAVDLLKARSAAKTSQAMERLEASAQLGHRPAMELYVVCAEPKLFSGPNAEPPPEHLVETALSYLAELADDNIRALAMRALIFRRADRMAESAAAWADYFAEGAWRLSAERAFLLEVLDRDRKAGVTDLARAPGLLRHRRAVQHQAGNQEMRALQAWLLRVQWSALGRWAYRHEPWLLALLAVAVLAALRPVYGLMALAALLLARRVRRRRH